MHNAKLRQHTRQHLGSRKQCALSRGHVSIRDREKLRYTIGAHSAQWSRICTMNRKRVSLLDHFDWIPRVPCLC